MNRITTFLYAEPSFTEGVARLFDWGGTLNEYNYSNSGQEADRNAMFVDWAAVSEDYAEVIKNFANDLD